MHKLKRRAKEELFRREGFNRVFGFGWFCDICKLPCGSSRKTWEHVRSDKHKENKLIGRLAK